MRKNAVFNPENATAGDASGARNCSGDERWALLRRRDEQRLFVVYKYEDHKKRRTPSCVERSTLRDAVCVSSRDERKTRCVREMRDTIDLNSEFCSVCLIETYFRGSCDPLNISDVGENITVYLDEILFVMAEDENVPVASVDDELAERLGVPLLESQDSASNEKGAVRARLGKRSQSSSPTTNSRTTSSAVGTGAPPAVVMGNSPCALKNKRVKVKANISRSRVIPELSPFIHLLPDMTRVDSKEQMEFYRVIYENSVRLYTCLQNYLALCVFGSSPLDSLTQTERDARLAAAKGETPLQESATMRERMDQAFEALCDEMQSPEITILPELTGLSPEEIEETLCEEGVQITTEALVHAISLYAGAGLRYGSS
ncbi:hypothetical protein ANCDUO_00549 [Ancylostoma duodenale]|uniref:Uncharacterized protein n=1 Tax=Ancylostoma duodenale TaxID=51022 RepID=A0A0C2DGL5_9BILA|nr:hypothetical protein ANCDUO_00549 [Ancylostoma duodenale]